VVLRAARQHQLEAAEQAGDQRPHTPPAAVGAGGDASVHQHQAGAVRGGAAQQVGPELGIDEEADLRPPVVEEGGDGAGQVDRHVLMDDPRRQPLGHQLRGGHGAAGHQDGAAGPVVPQTLDQRQGGLRLADAGAVDPEERPPRPRHAGLAEALAEAHGVFLAARQARAQIAAHQGTRQPAEQRVAAEGDLGRERCGRGHAEALPAKVAASPSSTL